MSRVVLITGAASGIGLGLALCFLDAGDRVVAFDQEAESAGSPTGGKARIAGEAIDEVNSHCVFPKLRLQLWNLISAGTAP